MHNDAEDWAALAVTGGLSEAERKTWDAHIATCPACQKLNDEQLAMSHLIQSTLTTNAPDAGFEQRIIQRLSEVQTKKGKRWHEGLLFHPILATAVACFLVAAVVGISLLIGGSKSNLASSAASADLTKLPAAVRDAIEHTAPGKNGVEG